MLMENIKYPIELEVITPLSVGAGNDNEWTRGIDYVQNEGKVYVIDIAKAAAAGVDIDRLTQLFLKSDVSGISTVLGSRLEDVSKYIFQSPVGTTNSIKAFLRTQLYDKPIVAGSSLKGSVRSALFNYLRTNEEKNEDVFGNMKDGTDLMRFIQIADVEMPSTILVNTKIFNLRKEGTEWFGGWKHGGTDREGDSHTNQHYNPVGFNTLYECVAPRKKGLGSITLAGNAFAQMAKRTSTGSITYREKKEELLEKDISHMFQVINRVTKRYLQKEKAFFEKYTAERSEELIDNIDYLLSLIPDDGSFCLLKMSAGVGFHSITGDWQYADYGDTGYWDDRRNAGKKKYKSRKRAEYQGRLQLMGFVRLRRLSQQESGQKAEELAQEHQKMAKEILAPIRQREAERLKAAQEELQRKKEMERESQRRNEYKALVGQAQQLYNNESWDEAISLLDKAALLASDESEHSLLLEQCIKAKEIASFRQSEQAAAAERFAQPLSEVIKGKTSAGNLVGTTVKWLKINTFGEDEFQTLVHEAKQLPPKEQVKLKNKKPDLIKAVGEEWTERFYQAIE